MDGVPGRGQEIGVPQRADFPGESETSLLEGQVFGRHISGRDGAGEDSHDGRPHSHQLSAQKIQARGGHSHHRASDSPQPVVVRAPDPHQIPSYPGLLLLRPSEILNYSRAVPDCHYHLRDNFLRVQQRVPHCQDGALQVFLGADCAGRGALHKRQGYTDG